MLSRKPLLLGSGREQSNPILSYRRTWSIGFVLVAAVVPEVETFSVNLTRGNVLMCPMGFQQSFAADFCVVLPMFFDASESTTRFI
jgi:hypothetical protein